MTALFLPFDQATLYNIVAELLAGETIGWLKQRRRAKQSYVSQVAEETAAKARAHGVNVEPKSLVALLKNDAFWDDLSADDTRALGLHLLPLIPTEDNPNQDEAAALLAAELVVAAVRHLPYEQRVQLRQLNRLESRLDNIHSSIQEIQAQISAGFSAVVQLLQEDNADIYSQGDQNTSIALTAWSKPAAVVCLAQLFRLQYPWGEWSDRRTELESFIAERRPRPGTAIPKPNVARTLFALEALDFFDGHDVDLARSLAINWMKSSVADGWFREWSEGQTSHSETQLPELVRRADVRHTAQVLTAFSRWQDSRDPLAGLIRSVSGSILPDSGFWPNNPRGTTPRLLASVYAVEALQTVTTHVFRLPLSDLVDRSEENGARRALRRGVGALLSDCEQGDGLVGNITSRPNPYLTGLALFRLGYLARRGSDLAELAELMVDGLLRFAQEYGWEDFSVPRSVRSRTRLRTTLRCAAGLSRASNAGINVPSALLEHALQLVELLITSEPQEVLDSPDYACGLISILLSRRDVTSLETLDSIQEENPAERSERLFLWRSELESLMGYLRTLAELDIPGYRDAADEYQTRLESLP